MPSLADGQSRFIACLQKGPGHFPDDLFAQDAERALLGLKAHANNISHARLVSLEDSFPRLHAHMGHETFHAISRDYVDQDHVMACDINHIASDFPNFLATREQAGTAIDLARIEWAWIESYRAAEATPVALTDIAALPEDALLAFPEALVSLHPLNALEQAIAGKIADSGTMGNLLAHALELGDEATAMQHIIKLIQAGAMTRIQG